MVTGCGQKGSFDPIASNAHNPITAPAEQPAPANQPVVSKVTVVDYFNYQDPQLLAEHVTLADIASTIWHARLMSIPAPPLERHYQAFAEAAPSRDLLVCYAVKANSNIALLNLLARLGSGFDIVSEGELRRVLQAGGDPAKVVFSGVGKSVTEIEFALQTGIKCFNVESDARTATYSASGQPPEYHCAYFYSGEPGYRRQNPSLYFNRFKGQ